MVKRDIATDQVWISCSGFGCNNNGPKRATLKEAVQFAHNLGFRLIERGNFTSNKIAFGRLGKSKRLWFCSSCIKNMEKW